MGVEVDPHPDCFAIRPPLFKGRYRTESAARSFIANDTPQLPRLHLAQRGRLHLAAVEHIGTARVEMATGRRLDRARHVALQHDLLALDGGVRHRHGGEQRLRVGMLRRGEQRLLVGVFDDAAEIHHGDVVADVLHHGEIVRDEQVSEAELVLQVHHEIEDLRLDRHVERRDRLVADDQARLQRERARDADALALPAGKLVRIVVDMLGAQPDALEDVGDARAAFLGVADAMHAQRLADDVACRHARVERGERVLEDDLHLPAIGAQLRLAEMRDVGAVDLDAARGRLDQAQDRAADCGFAAAGFTDQRERLARADFE